MAVGIHKTLCGGRNINNLIEPKVLILILVEFTCFYLKVIRVHIFCSNLSQVHMFCDYDRSKLEPESTQPGVFMSWMIVDN